MKTALSINQTILVVSLLATSTFAGWADIVNDSVVENVYIAVLVYVLGVVNGRKFGEPPVVERTVETKTVETKTP